MAAYGYDLGILGAGAAGLTAATGSYDHDWRINEQ